MDGWIFGWRYIAGLLFVHVLGNPDSKRSAAGWIECRRAGDDAVKIVRENLRGFQPLPSSGGAAIEVREFCVVTIKRIDQALAFDCRFMNCPGPEVDALIGILHPDACAAFVAGIGRGRRISPAESSSRALLSMLPFHPPFPTTSNFPFQLVAGIHTSIFMSESFVGFTVAAIRQNAGRSANCAPPPRPPPPAGAKAPAATACADVIVVSASFNAARLSQGAADAGTTLTRRTSNTADDRTILLIRTPRECSVNVGGIMTSEVNRRKENAA